MFICFPLLKYTRINTFSRSKITIYILMRHLQDELLFHNVCGETLRKIKHCMHKQLLHT